MNLFSRGDDLQHIALLLYGRLPTMFGFSKTDTAAVVGEVLQSGIGWMTLCPMVGSSQIPSKTATLGTTHRNCVRE